MAPISAAFKIRRSCAAFRSEEVGGMEAPGAVLLQPGSTRSAGVFGRADLAESPAAPISAALKFRRSCAAVRSEQVGRMGALGAVLLQPRSKRNAGQNPWAIPHRRKQRLESFPNELE